MLSDDSLLSYALGAAKLTMEHNGEHPPTLIGITEDNAMQVFVLAVEGHPFDAMMAVIPALRQGPSMQALALVTDTYMVKGKPEDENEFRAMAGKLDQYFERGDPRVTEAVMVMVVKREGEPRQAHQAYRRNDDGTITWDDPTTPHAGVTGRMASVMMLALDQAGKDTK